MSQTKYPTLAAYDKYAAEYKAVHAFADDHGLSQLVVDAWFKDAYDIDMAQVEKERQQMLADMLG